MFPPKIRFFKFSKVEVYGKKETKVEYIKEYEIRAESLPKHVLGFPLTFQNDFPRISSANQKNSFDKLKKLIFIRSKNIQRTRIWVNCTF